jgi:hypothetical protein
MIVGSLATAGLTAYSMSQMGKAQNQSAAQLTALQNSNNAQAVDTLPKPPEAPTNGEGDAATNPAEQERQKQLAAMAANDAMVNPTSGLGLSAPAKTKKQSLGGAS